MAWAHIWAKAASVARVMPTWEHLRHPVLLLRVSREPNHPLVETIQVLTNGRTWVAVSKLVAHEEAASWVEYCSLVYQ